MARKKQWMPSSRAPVRRHPTRRRRRSSSLLASLHWRRLKPRFLPQIMPTQWNYVIDIHGAWAAGRYRFMQRYKSGMEHNRGDEFDAPFARIDRMGPDRFDIYWMRHTGKWWRPHVGVTLAEALRILETDGVLYPV
jgi:hypothetical protein